MVAALFTVPLFKRLGLGSVLGYLTAGILIGPAVSGLVVDVESILHFSELGVVLLLFIIGLELQPTRLWALRKPVFGMGGVQVMVTGVALTLIGMLLGLRWDAALVAGVGLALSSTAFCLQILAERGHLRTAYGRKAFSILLFQDLAVVPVLALVPQLAPGTAAADDLSAALLAAGKAVGVIVAVVVLGHYVVGRFLGFVVKTKVPEMFTAAALAVVVGVSLLMEAVGLSMALGAFLAGVLLADSLYRHELEATIEPFKGLLLGLFFIAVGMSVDLGLIFNHPGVVFGLVAGLLVVKGTILFLLGRVFGASPRSALSLAALMPQGGEFGFVIFGVATATGILAEETADLLLVVVALSMAITPILVRLNALAQNRAPKVDKVPSYDSIDAVEDHRVIIAGFGRFGQIIARTLRMAGIPFTALEADFEQIGFVRRFGNTVHYGDPSRPDLLRAAGIDRAEVFVLAVDDPEKALTIAAYVRAHYPEVRVLARARNRNHAYKLMEQGVYKVFRETYASSLEMAEEVFLDLGYSETMATRTVTLFREHDEALMAEQFEIRHDEEALIASAREAAEELRGLFEHDGGADHLAPDLRLPSLEVQGDVCPMPRDPGAKGTET
ncbi:MAG: monovalent cation:proton antiporter-2 (CPA2) family protein [Rhodospirillum sp.]|nr:monovalent cation:proton antiporter-2 (CPA2) family protein [Rhodospirillum sp.]MCF8490905.1 monovalent cation:proton antiporter-2 (CPA2) family protein [Rhodospirillum sp.]MCF8499092.1 monovalent cation:proton antiporter-2 (CPA2) family protein [Rhodospirillum sp.]